MSFVLKRMGQYILFLLYPPKCPICRCLLPYGRDICFCCAQKLRPIEEPRCPVCGKPSLALGKPCFDCGKRSHLFQEGVGLFLYEPPLKDMLMDIKYRGRRRLCRLMGRLLWREGKPYLEKWQTDLLVPVPIHKARLRKRGFNQAELIAKELGKWSGISVTRHAVERNISGEAMKTLSKRQRFESSEVFVRGKDSVRGKRVTIIDDIYTTGATADAVSRVLTEAGAASVTFLSVCIGEGFMVKY